MWNEPFKDMEKKLTESLKQREQRFYEQSSPQDTDRCATTPPVQSNRVEDDYWNVVNRLHKKKGLLSRDLHELDELINSLTLDTYKAIRASQLLNKHE